MKYIILIGVIYLIYRFYNKPKKIERGGDEFPQQPPMHEEELGEYTDYEEIE